MTKSVGRMRAVAGNRQVTQLGGKPNKEQRGNINGDCEARTPNEESRQLPSSGTVTPPEKAQLRIRTNSINGTRNSAVITLEVRVFNIFFK